MMYSMKNVIKYYVYFNYIVNIYRYIKRNYRKLYSNISGLGDYRPF